MIFEQVMTSSMRCAHQPEMRAVAKSGVYRSSGMPSMLLAVFHLTEELLAREDLAGVTGADAAHLSGDMERAFHALAAQWLQHTSSLQKNYPYLFSLEARRNPFGCCSAPVE